MANGTCECNFKVEYCCVENVPTFFNNDFSTLKNEDCRLFYDPTCLCCVVKPCEVEIECTTGSYPSKLPVEIYAATIVGCMPYQAEWRFDNPATCNVPTSSGRNASICCLSTACFDNAIKFGCKEDLEIFCECINDLLNDPSKACSLIKNSSRDCQLFKCDDFTEITSQSTEGKCTNRFVKFSGDFDIDNTFLTNECNGQ